MSSEYTMDTALSFRSNVLSEISDARDLAEDLENNISNYSISDIQSKAETLVSYINDIENAMPCEEGFEDFIRNGPAGGGWEPDHDNCTSDDDVALRYGNDRWDRNNARVVGFDDLVSLITSIRRLQAKFQDRALAVLVHRLEHEGGLNSVVVTDGEFNDSDFDATTYRNDA